MTAACEWCGTAIVPVDSALVKWATAKCNVTTCDASDDGLHGPGEADEVRPAMTARGLHDYVFTFPARITGAHDGDTVYAVIDQGFGFRNHGTKKTIDGVTLRILGISAIELGQPGGVETRDYVRGLLVGEDVVLRTVKDDKYGGRFLAVVQMHDGTDVATHLVEDGWAVWWDGTGTPPYPTWPRAV